MANLLKYTGGALTQGNPPETWTAPTSMFGTQRREDTGAGTFASTTSRWTAPVSDIPDGYLFVGAFEYHDTSNGRIMPQARFAQISGTGNFVTGSTGGYARDTSDDRAYVRTWAFYDGPSASATVDFQWKADADDATGGTERSELQVIPFYYSDIGLYASASNALYGGTTPNRVTGFSGADGTNITLSGDVVSVAGDNKRYIVLASQFFEGRGGRTQRWHGLEIDGTQEDAAKAYSYYRNTSNDESGDLFTWPIETSTATVTIEQNCYRGDGVGSGQGGADGDGSAPSVGDHTLVVLELNDSAELFRSRATSQSPNVATTGPVDLDVNETTDFNDAASFTDVVNSSINCVQTADYLFGANVSCASTQIATGSRWTGYSEFTVNGIENADSVSGDYLRNNQGSIDTFGWSANLLGFEALTAGDDVGVSVTELLGSEGGSGGVVSPAGWTGFWGINLDSMQDAGGVTLVVAEAAMSQAVDAPALTQSSALSLVDALLSVTSETPVLVQANTLGIDEASQALQAEGVALTQAVSIAVQDALFSVFLDSPVVAEASTLAVAESVQALLAGTPELLQSNTLAVADIVQALTVDNAVLTQAASLIVADSLQSMASELVSLSGSSVLSVIETLQAVLVDSPAIQQASTLVMLDTLQSVGADNVSLSQSISLGLADALQSTLADSPSLTQANVLAVSEALQGLSVDAPSLSGSSSLAIADALHSLSVDNITLSSAGVLSIADALQIVSADIPQLSQASTIIVSDSVQAILVDGLTLSQSTILAVQETIQSVGIDPLLLTQQSVLGVANAVLSLQSQNMGVSQETTLIVSDALMDLLSANVPIGELVGSKELIYVVETRSRRYVIARRERTITVH